MTLKLRQRPSGTVTVNGPQSITLNLIMNVPLRDTEKETDTEYECATVQYDENDYATIQY